MISIESKYDCAVIRNTEEMGYNLPSSMRDSEAWTTMRRYEDGRRWDYLVINHNTNNICWWVLSITTSARRKISQKWQQNIRKWQKWRLLSTKNYTHLHIHRERLEKGGRWRQVLGSDKAQMTSHFRMSRVACDFALLRKKWEEVKMNKNAIVCSSCSKSKNVPLYTYVKSDMYSTSMSLYTVVHNLNIIKVVSTTMVTFLQILKFI